MNRYEPYVAHTDQGWPKLNETICQRYHLTCSKLFDRRKRLLFRCIPVVVLNIFLFQIRHVLHLMVTCSFVL